MISSTQVFDKENEDDTNHRRNIPFFGSMMSSIKRRGGSGSGVSGGGGPGGPGGGGGGGPGGGGPVVTLNVNAVQHAKISPTNSADYAAQNSFRKIPDE